MKLPVCAPIDKLLNGGLESGCITNFYGPSATGKSQIVMQAIVNCINSGKKAVLVDTEGGFSMERLEQVSGNIKNASDKIILIEPKEWDEQKAAIRKLDKIKDTIGLIAVDSVVALWRLTIDEKNAQEINKELAIQLSVLSKISREKNIPVIITNQVYSDIETGRTEMSARNIVKWWSKNIVELGHAGRTGCRFAVIRKARSLPEDKQIEFEICDEGLRETKFRLF